MTDAGVEKLRKALPGCRILPEPKADGFVPLFNGKDLAGWKTHPDQPGGWTVEAGNLVGRGQLAHHLFTERGDFEDFHLRAELKLMAHPGSPYFWVGQMRNMPFLEV